MNYSQFISLEELTQNEDVYEFVEEVFFKEALFKPRKINIKYSKSPNTHISSTKDPSCRPRYRFGFEFQEIVNSYLRDKNLFIAHYAQKLNPVQTDDKRRHRNIISGSLYVKKDKKE